MDLRIYKSKLNQIQIIESKIQELDNEISDHEIKPKSNIWTELIIFCAITMGILLGALLSQSLYLVWALLWFLLFIIFLIYLFFYYNSVRKEERAVVKLIKERLRYEDLLKTLPKKDELLKILGEENNE